MTSLGLGLGLRPPHIADILNSRPALGFFEIISENFMSFSGTAFANLKKILEFYPVVLHGVNMSIGSADELNFDYLKRLKKLAQITKAPWVSDHLCFSSVDGRYLHDLLPLPFTKKAARYVIERIKRVQDYLKLPFALENISSYVSLQQSEMTEYEFYNHIIEESGCYSLLDVNNVYVSSVNHGFNPLSFLETVNYDRVIQIHLAGHTELEDGSLLDTHDHFVKEQVWQLYSYVISRCKMRSTLLEWDANFLNLEQTLDELKKAGQYQTL